MRSLEQSAFNQGVVAELLRETGIAPLRGQREFVLVVDADGWATLDPLARVVDQVGPGRLRVALDCLPPTGQVRVLLADGEGGAEVSTFRLIGLDPSTVRVGVVPTRRAPR
jgi:hypothetical protein